MRKLLLSTILISSLIFTGCSKDDDNKGDNKCFTCGSMTICKIDNEPNKVKVTAHGTETIGEILVDGKTFEDINCDNTLEMIGITAE